MSERPDADLAVELVRLEADRVRLAEQGRSLELASCDRKIAAVLFRIGRRDEAFSRFEAAQELFAAADVLAEVADVDLELADLFVSIERHDDALTRREKARATLAHVDATLARFDAESASWSLFDSAVGPAGVAVLELPEGMTLIVDRADPARAVSLSVELPRFDAKAAPSSKQLAMVAAVAGEETARLLDQRPEKGRETMPLPLDRKTVSTRRQLSRLALLEELRAEEAVDEEPVSPLWAAEAAVIAAGVDPRVGLASRARAEASAGYKAITKLASQTLSPQLHERVLELLGSLPPLVQERGAKRALEQARERLSGEDLSRRSSRARPLEDVRKRVEELRRRATSPMLVPAPALAWRDAAVDRQRAAELGLISAKLKLPEPTKTLLQSRSVRVHIEPTVSWARATGDLAVRLALASDASAKSIEGLWARVFARQDLTPLAMAPFLYEAPQAERELPSGIARLSLPADLELNDVLLDVTDRPTEAAPESALGLLRRASQAGALATRSERLGAWNEAESAWRSCSELWNEFGDSERQAIALAYAGEVITRHVGDVQGIVLCERADAIAQGWARHYLNLRRPSRDIVDAFVSELASAEER